MRITGMGSIVAGALAAAAVGFAGLAAGFAGLAGVARAEGAAPPVVVELFTSQGCSACPPADRLLSDLAERDDVLALSLHVDYWDYIGWADSFARPEHTARQRAYARAAGEGMIYTPQMVVGGTHRVMGARAMSVLTAIESHAAAPAPVSVRLERRGDRLSVEAAASADAPERMVVQIVRYRPERTVRILRGENAGHTFTYSNIVTAWERVADWSGAEPLALTVEMPGADPAAVIVQAAGHGRIVGAAATR
jgi:hypothetical protein